MTLDGRSLPQKYVYLTLTQVRRLAADAVMLAGFTQLYAEPHHRRQLRAAERTLKLLANRTVRKRRKI